MSKQYDEFKKRTIEATDVISKAHNMRALSDDFFDGFAKAMWEAREIYMRLEDDFASKESEEPTSQNIKVNDDGTISPIDAGKPSSFRTHPKIDS